MICLASAGDTQVLAQSEGTLPIGDPEVHRLGPASLLTGDRADIHVEHLGSRGGMDIKPISEGFLHVLSPLMWAMMRSSIWL
jgi:hypothetical protein